MTVQQQQILAQGNFSSMEEAKAAKEWALAQLGPGQRAEVERRIDQQLKRERRAALAALEREHGSEVAAGAIAAHRQAVRVYAQGGALRGAPLQRGARIVHGGGKRMLGCQPVVDGEYRTVTQDGEVATRHQGKGEGTWHVFMSRHAGVSWQDDML